jgi:hypothetical protein
VYVTAGDCNLLLGRWGRGALAIIGVAIGVTRLAQLALTGGLSRGAGDLANLGRADFGVFQAYLADLIASSLPSVVNYAAIVIAASGPSSTTDRVPGELRAQPRRAKRSMS